MAIDRETVHHYAKLAHIEFNDQEADTLAGQLQQILDYAACLNELDLEGVEATAHISHAEQPRREDQVTPSLGRAIAVGNAADKEAGHFLVPKVINVK